MPDDPLDELEHALVRLLVDLWTPEIRAELDLRAMRLTEVKALRDDPKIGERLRRAIDAELLERLAAQDLDDAADEQTF